MSSLRELSFIALPVVIGMAFILGIHEYSKADTVKNIQRIAARRAVADSTQTARKFTQMEVLVARVAVLAARAAEKAASKRAAEKAAAIAALPGDPTKGKVAFITCMACHGMKGEGVRVFNSPRLASQPPWYLKRQLLKFRAGVRGGHPQDVFGMQMVPMAKLLTREEDVDDVVAYIATLEPDSPVDRGQGDPESGKASFAICATCHGRRAEGIESQKAPGLIGQHAWYMNRQLKNFKSGARGFHKDDIEGKPMVSIAQMLKDDSAIEDLVAYIQSLTWE